MVADRFAVSVLHIVCTADGCAAPRSETSRTKIWRFEGHGHRVAVGRFPGVEGP